MAFPFPGIPLRLSPSGPNIEGANDGDLLIWSQVLNAWTVGPGAGAVLAGDTNGPSANNRTTSLSEVGLATELQPITSLAPSGTEVSFLIAPIGGGSLFLSPASVALAGFEGAFDFVLKSRADLLAVPGVGVGPAFTLPSGSYAIKVGFALNAGESLSVGAGIQVLMMGMGGTKFLAGNVAAGVVDVAATGQAVLYSMNISNTANGGRAVTNAGDILSALCSFTCNTTGGQGANQTAGTWKDTGSSFTGGTSDGFHLTGGTLNATDAFFTGGSTSDGLNLSGATAMAASLRGCSLNASGSGQAVDMGASNGALKLTDCFLNGTSANAMNCSAGTTMTSGCTFTSVGDCLAHSGGAATHINVRMRSSAGNCITGTNPGASVYVLKVVGGDLRTTGGAGNCINWDALLAHLDLVDVDLATDINSGTLFLVAGGSTIEVNGGTWETVAASPGTGLALTGANIPGGFMLNQVHGKNISSGDGTGEAWLKYNSGTVNRCNIVNCDMSDSVLTAINWPAASIPARGLSIVNCTFCDVSPFVGFTHATARVNSKGNLGNAGLMSETPIVP